ncbi:MAG: sigma-54-dependent Fis family transcriptional regulator [Candidatus Eisenbacteria bacterium]|uniref:Sigma-54-dependent Fis family transcriptional regulator n=1 Tax=Eiseniibacteriota bacterium TaxID=2212470 RepID=A0A849SIF2_UNCEI|nr:sigma-54-dependent Fis family transcriptional regulator [Candidatus Eisenbacteria bacterium]
MSTILCIDDEPSVGVTLEHALTELGHDAILTTSVEEGLVALDGRGFDLVITDYPLVGADGRDVLTLLQEREPDTPVIAMANYATHQEVVASIRRGAVDYLTKPLRQEALRLAVNNALEIGRLRRENEDIRQEITRHQGSGSIIGTSAALQAVLDVIAAVAPTRATVLLEGESGTGKELFARAIHEQSTRREGSFVTMNCAALPEGLVESTLFGHERGAFTGATSRSHGAFERAHRGTLLLDEISEMRLDLQSKLLRALQEQEFERVGGAQAIKVDVRLIATTNRDLRAEIDAGRFRRDLFYRLSVVPIRTPPLRDRIEDVPALVDHFVRHFALQLGVRVPQVTPEIYAALCRRRWLGNVRELANAVERAVILSRGGALDTRLFEVDPPMPTDGNGPLGFGVPFGMAAEPPAPHGFGPLLPRVSNGGSLLDGRADGTYNLRQLEKHMIQRALQATGGHRLRAAALLGISDRTLRKKLSAGRGPLEA